MKRSAVLIACIIALLGTAPASGQTYPTKQIRIVVPFVAGGAVDLLARIMGQKLSESFGQTVIIENRPGAGGNAAADLVAKAPPDGHTILQTTNGLAISPVLYRKLPFDPVKDLAPVTQVEVAEWCVRELGLPAPASISLAEARVRMDKDTLAMFTQSKRLRPEATLARLRVTLRFPTYREGFRDVWAREKGELLRLAAESSIA